MNKFATWMLLITSSLLLACSPIKTPVANQFKLSDYSNRQLVAHRSKHSIFISAPEAVAGYQTQQMLYIKKAFELSPFANNAWVDPPGEMLLPLIAQSLQRSGYFNAVTSGANSEHTDYRLDTQLIELQQNFLKKPSELDLVVKVVLTKVNQNRIISSRLFSKHLRCPTDTPYGGVIAANRAARSLTAELTNFVVTQIRQNPPGHT